MPHIEVLTMKPLASKPTNVTADGRAMLDSLIALWVIFAWLFRQILARPMRQWRAHPGAPVPCHGDGGTAVSDQTILEAGMIYPGLDGRGRAAACGSTGKQSFNICASF